MSLFALEQATGWQPHTLRAAITRLRQAGHRVERSRSADGGTVYRIVEGDAAHKRRTWPRPSRITSRPVVTREPRHDPREQPSRAWTGMPSSPSGPTLLGGAPPARP